LVDDHPVLRAGVNALLCTESDFLIVGEADNGFSAVQLSRSLEPDVIVMDISLPTLSGTDATKQILQANPKRRILVLSAHEEVAFARMLMGLGVAGYALKRSAGDELVRAVRIVAQGDTYVDPILARALVVTGTRQPSPVGMPAVSLSEREAEVVRLIARGHSSKEMAETLGISPRTLETYKARAMTKLGLRTRADLIRYALRCGWLRDV